MKVKMKAGPIFLVALFAAVILLCIASASQDVNSVLGGVAEREEVKVNLDLTRMNPTMRMTHMYRLAANPREFAGKMLRISGTFLTRVDKEDGRRYFGCLMGEPGGCSCCAPGGVLEFMPKDSYIWPTNYPPVESRITVTGRLKMFEVGPKEQSVTIPCLVDADMSWKAR